MCGSLVLGSSWLIKTKTNNNFTWRVKCCKCPKFKYSSKSTMSVFFLPKGGKKWNKVFVGSYNASWESFWVTQQLLRRTHGCWLSRSLGLKALYHLVFANDDCRQASTGIKVWCLAQRYSSDFKLLGFPFFCRVLHSPFHWYKIKLF